MIGTRLPNMFIAILCLVVGLGITPRPATAGPILYDTFGPGDTFNTAGAYGVDGNTSFQAFRFVPTVTGTLEQITVALGRTSAAQASTTFNLYQDAGGVNLGALIESFNVVNAVAPDGVAPFTGAVVTFASVVVPVLTSGVAYWLSFTEPEALDGADSLWLMNSVGALGTRLTHALPAQQNFLPAFRVEAQAVPEPSVIALLALALAGLGFSRRRRLY